MAVQSRARGSSGHQGLGAPVASTNPPSAHGRLIAALFDIHSQRPRSDGAKHGQIDSDPDLFRVESFAELSRILARVGCNEKVRQGGIEWPTPCTTSARPPGAFRPPAGLAEQQTGEEEGGIRGHGSKLFCQLVLIAVRVL